MTLGTFDYISPEQARDPRDVDVRSDLYSLGCTMFHMLTGRPPFPEGTVLQKLLQHQEEPAPDVRTLNPSVPPDLAAIILKLMAKDRDRRYQTPEQLVRDLLTLAGSLGLRSVSPEGLVWMSSTPPPGSWERHLIWGLPSVALAVVVTLLVWWGEQDPGSTAPLAMPRPKPAPAQTSTPNVPPQNTATPASSDGAGGLRANDEPIASATDSRRDPRRGVPGRFRRRTRRTAPRGRPGARHSSSPTRGRSELAPDLGNRRGHHPT